MVRSLQSEQKGMDWDELLGDLSFEARLAFESTDRRIRVTELIIDVDSN